MSKGKRNFTDEQEEGIAQRYVDGESARGIAKSFGLDKTSILAALRRQGVDQRSPSERNRLYSLDENAFDVITPEAAYWWGFLYADGYINRRSVVLGLKWSDADHVEKFNKFMSSDAPLKKYTHKLNGKIYYSCNLGITSQHLSDRLRELGIVPHRTAFERVISNLPEDMVAHWLRGFFDGDGTISKNKHGRFTTGFMGRLEVMEWVREKLPFAQESKSIQKHIISNVFYLKFHGNRASTELTHYLYSNQTLYMDRKYNKAMSIPPPHVYQRNDLGQFCG
jgi:hypothetical protein